MTYDNFHITPQISRRAVLRSFLGVALLASSQPLALAKEDGLFKDKPQELDGALSQFADQLGKRAKSMGKRGKYAEVLFEELQKGDEQARLDLYTRAREGDDYARTIIGWMFDNGYHAAVNSAQAAQMFIQAAPKIPLANYNLGVLFLHGRGVVLNERRAMGYFNEADRIGPAFVQLADFALRENKGNTALHFAETAAKLKDPAGMYIYGRLLLEKGEDKEGARYISQSASKNHPKAVASMIVIYEKGMGVSADPGMAAGWWIVDQVLNGKQLQQRSEEAMGRFSLNDSDKSKALRFSRKWLLNRTVLAPFDYTKTLNFQDLKGAGPRLL